MASTRGPLPWYCEPCAPSKQARHAARQRAIHDERDQLRVEVAELRRSGGIGTSERRRLALATDLLAAYAAVGLGDGLADDEAIADLTIRALRVSETPHGRKLAIQLAGAWLARAQVISETLADAQSERRKAA